MTPRAMTPRVCIVSPAYHPGLGGVGRQALLLAERMRREGVELFVVSRAMKDLPSARFSPDVEVVRVPTLFPGLINLETVSLKELLVSLTFSGGLAYQLFANRRRYDVVHFHGASVPFLACLPVLKLLGKKVIAKVAAARLGTEAGSFSGRYGFAGGLLARWARLADGVVAISEEIHEGLVRDGFPEERIHRIPNFVDEALFCPCSDEEKEAAKAGHGYAGKQLVLFAGRLVPRKGVETLLAAWATVASELPDARLAILGEGPSGRALEARAAALGLSATCRFAGRVDDVPGWLRAADVFVLPSAQEGLPNALLEAMATGLPSVATRIGGVVDVVEDKKTALLFEAGDAGGLVAQLRSLLSSPARRRELGAAAADAIRRSYGLESRVPKYLALYSAQVSPRPGPPPHGWL